MAYTSPFADPTAYVNRINDLTTEVIAIDKDVAQATRDAENFASKYSLKFQLVVDLKNSTEEFNQRWTEALLKTRDAASSISGWYQRYSEVFLDLINDIASAQDAKDVVLEFNNFLGEEFPSKKYDLDSTAGVKEDFEDIENLVVVESKHVIKVLQTGNWQKAVEKLQEGLPDVKAGIRRIRQAFNSYATKVE